MNTLQINVDCACKKLNFLLAHALQKEFEFFINYENHYAVNFTGSKCSYDILIVSVLIVSQFFYYN